MRATPRSKALPWLAAMTAVALLAAALFWLSREEASPPAGPTPEEKLATLRRDAPPDLPPHTLPAPAPVAAPSLPEPDAGPPPVPDAGSPEPEAPQVHPVDLAKLREQLPDNLYWEIGAPTQDPQVLQRRAETERKWNELKGKVLSSTATEEEIHQYYDHRRAVSEDFIAFASLVLQQYGNQLSEEERGLYELSIRMHRTRLEEMPAQMDDAFARKRLQDERRKAWLKSGRVP